jgi:hypothetical protein
VTVHWRWARAVCLITIMLLAAGIAAPAAAQTDLDPSLDPNAQALTDKFAPVMYLAIQAAPCDKNGEAYFPAPVDMVLGNEQIVLMDGDLSEEVARGLRRMSFVFPRSPTSTTRGSALPRLFLRPGISGGHASAGGDLRPRHRRGT